jgi:hypothetical protein
MVLYERELNDQQCALYEKKVVRLKHLSGFEVEVIDLSFYVL